MTKIKPWHEYRLEELGYVPHSTVWGSKNISMRLLGYFYRFELKESMREAWRITLANA